MKNRKKKNLPTTLYRYTILWNVRIYVHYWWHFHYSLSIRKSILCPTRPFCSMTICRPVMSSTQRIFFVQNGHRLHREDKSDVQESQFIYHTPWRRREQYELAHRFHRITILLYYIGIGVNKSCIILCSIGGGRFMYTGIILSI